MSHRVRDGVAMPSQAFRLDPLVQNGEGTSGKDRHRSIAKLPQLILIVDGAVDYMTLPVRNRDRQRGLRH
jgi:hypothetical protein